MTEKTYYIERANKTENNVDVKYAKVFVKVDGKTYECATFSNFTKAVEAIQNRNFDEKQQVFRTFERPKIDF